MDEFLRMLDFEDSLPSTSEAQKQANRHRREVYAWLTRERLTPSETVFTDFNVEILKKRLVDPNYRFSVRSLLDE